MNVITEAECSKIHPDGAQDWNALPFGQSPKICLNRVLKLVSSSQAILTPKVLEKTFILLVH